MLIFDCRHLFTNQLLLTVDLGEEMTLAREGIDFTKKRIELFLREKNCRIQKVASVNGLPLCLNYLYC